MSENLRVLRFAVIVCLACSVLVSAAALGLRDRQETNLLLDIRKNILKAVGLFEPGMDAERVTQLFDERMVGLVLTREGEVVEGRTADSVDPDREPDLLRLYEYQEQDEIRAYAFPIQGQGLWSTVYGYLSLGADLNTITGITFYKHGETPGLGGEIEKAWFQDQYVGKKVLDEEGRIVGVATVKGKAAEVHPENLEHYVDGISGATITADAVDDMMLEALKAYEPFFARIRRGKETT